ncbi:MAG: dipeptide epimerase, partial [Alphaproteobacteria bacterium]|nr:dipeptide epimerase [Alphaproteobacteria bacterium]
TADAIARTLGTFDFSAIEALEPAAARQALLTRLSPGSARNALDCALWDLEAKSRGIPVWRLAALPPPQPLATCYTLSLDAPAAMARQAGARRDCPLLKLKLGDADGDPGRMRAIRKARPDARLVCDANEGWSATDLAVLATEAASAGIELIEQPLRADADQFLAQFDSPVPLCADESAAPGADIRALPPRYQAVNIKLDKTGGLTAALQAAAEAKRLGLRIMIGSMVSTSLAMAPAALLGSLADWIDLDSPLLLARDRRFAMTFADGYLAPPSPELWG